MDFSAVSGGIFPAELIRSLIHANHIFGAFPNNIRNVFLDLTATEEIYRIPGALVPQKGERIRSLLKKASAIHLPPGSPLERGCSYLVRLRETLVLPSEVFGRFAFEGSGAFDLELVGDGVCFVNEVPPGYVGELWARIVPHRGAFLLEHEVRAGSLSFFTKHSPLSLNEVLVAHNSSSIFYDRNGNATLPVIHEERGIFLTLYAEAPLFAETSLKRHVQTAECIRLSEHVSARIRVNHQTFYLPPEFGSDASAGLPIALSLGNSEDAFWQPNQPLCSFELLPTAKQKQIPNTLYTQPPPPNVKTE